MRRLVLPEAVLSPDACDELIGIARVVSLRGYRPCVASCTLPDVAAQCAALMVPLLAAREAVRAALEEALSQPLLVEFTGLICWRPGAALGWHADNDRAYLAQRSASAICYLNTAGRDFEGGTLRFQDGEPHEVLAMPGRVVAYSAADVHSVDAVVSGERFTLNLWFTDDVTQCEDTRLLGQLSGSLPRRLGLPATMWRLPDGTDLRLCRLAMVGLALVWRGQVLHEMEGLPVDGASLEPVSPPLQLVVLPSALRTWLDWDSTQPAADLHAPAPSDAGSHATAAAVPEVDQALETLQALDGAEFGSVQEVLLAVQHWVQRRGGRACHCERVCTKHLADVPAPEGPASSCTWLRTRQLQPRGTGGPAWLSAAAAELRAAALISARRMSERWAALDELHVRWQRVGALFCE